jgi:transposase-like protein
MTVEKVIRPTSFKWRQTAPEFILCAVRWYLRYSLSLRDVEELLTERMFKKFHLGARRLSINREAAMSSMVPEVCTLYS